MMPWVQGFFQPTKSAFRHQSPEATHEICLEFPFEVVDHKANRTFEGFQADIAGKTIGNTYIKGSLNRSLPSA